MRFSRTLNQLAVTPEQIRERISRTQTAANELVAEINNASARGRLPVDQVRVLQNAYVQPAMDALGAATREVTRNNLEAAARWIDEADRYLVDGLREIRRSESTSVWTWGILITAALVIGGIWILTTEWE